VLCPIVPVAAEHTLALVLRIVTYTLFLLNFCIATSLQLLYILSIAFGGGEGQWQCLWDYNLIFEMNSSGSTLGVEASGKEYDALKVGVKSERINVGCFLPE